ncbi:phage tail length tape measure family protein [Curtobacterium sp. Csp2]|uniref:phage tail protein n=1 Tax=Curtobacterium sp. Csp2 TaxID=2495430 RepID=UPI001580791C|nr:phage tail length tape measure family protein [Curtobacterium sp. Csp2]QKS15595.1 phage tail length tape measure family protein [Curtobacterium sp. Csp2]
MAGQTVNVSVLAETSKFTRGFAEAGKTAEGFGSKLGKVGLAVGAAVLATGAGVIAIGVQSAKALARIETLNAQTGAAITSTGGAAGQSLEHIQKVSGELERLTSVEAESIQEGQNLLLTFTNIRGPVFDEATKSATDMATALGTDVKTQALSLGKALNDPISGVTKLGRVGVTFTDEQKKQIENYSQMGDLASAQGVILAEVNKEFGGSAEAYGNTITGVRDKVLNEWGTVGETLTSAFMPAAKGVLQFANDFLVKLNDSQGFADFANSFSAGVQAVFNGQAFSGIIAVIQSILPIVSAAFGPILPIIGQLGGAFLALAPNLSPVMLIFQALQPVLPSLAAAIGQLATGVLSTLVGLFTTLAPIVAQIAQTFVTLLSGVFVALMPAVVQIVSTFGSALVQLTPVLQMLVGAIFPVVSALISGLMPVILMLVQTVLPPLVALFSAVIAAVVPLVAQIVSALMPAFQAIVPIIQPVVAILASVLIPIIQALLPVVTTVFNAIVPIIQAALQVVSGIIKIVTGVISGNWSQVWEGILDVLSGVWNLIKSVVIGALSILGSVVRAGLSIIGTVFSAVWNGIVAVVTSVANSIVNGVRGMASGIGDGIRTAIDWVTSLGSKITGALSNAGSLLVDAGGRVIDGFVRGITNGMSAISAIASRIGNAIMDGVKGILGIHSPSREMAKLGRFSVQGFAKGLGDLAPVEGAMRRMTDLVSTPIAMTAFADADPIASPTYITVRAEMLEPTPTAGRVIADALDEWRRRNGGR